MNSSLASSINTLNSAALGEKKSSLVLKNCNLLSVYTREIIPKTQIAIINDRIAYVGPNASHTIGSKTKKQLEALLGRAQNVLYDELLHIPLIFYGCGIQNQKIISQQVRQVDTFPTLIDMLNISDTNDVDGQSLVPLVNGDSLNELPAYIETGVRWVKTAKEIIEPKFEGKIIGIRTPSYKYWRSRTDSTKDVTLYDLQQDPNEEVNIAEKNHPIVDEMEQILNSMKKTFTPNNQNTFSSEEEKKIAAELTKLGYL